MLICIHEVLFPILHAAIWCWRRSAFLLNFLSSRLTSAILFIYPPFLRLWPRKLGPFPKRATRPSLMITHAGRKQFRVGPDKIRSSAEGASTLGWSGGMLPREMLKFSFFKTSVAQRSPQWISAWLVRFDPEPRCHRSVLLHRKTGWQKRKQDAFRLRGNLIHTDEG